MDIGKPFLSKLFYILLVTPSLALAVIITGPAQETSYLFIVITVLGGIIALLGIILTFRGVTSPAEVTINIPGGGTFKFSRIGQGVILAIVGAIVLVSALYFHPTTTKSTTTETTTITDESGTHTVHSETSKR